MRVVERLQRIIGKQAVAIELLKNRRDDGEKVKLVDVLARAQFGRVYQAREESEIMMARKPEMSVFCISALFALLFLVAPLTNVAAQKPLSIAEIAVYQGADREQVLIQGAKKEREVVFYNSHTWFKTLAQEFEKKYPFVKVSGWRSDSKKILKRVTEEYRAGRHLVDVVETTGEAMAVLQREGFFQEYISPELRFYTDEHKAKGKTGVYYLADRETYISLGFNTTLVSRAEAPKTLKDLLDPRWKGKMSIAGTSTGVRWVGAVLLAMGREFLEKLAEQQIKIQNISGAALAGLVVSGEVPLSPTIFDANIFTAKQKGAPVEWRPLEPVAVNVGSSGMLKRAPGPHAALLFLEYLHSKEGQEVMMKGGLKSPREDIGSLEQRFKKTYLEAKYSVEELEQKLVDWEQLMRQLVTRKR